MFGSGDDDDDDGGSDYDFDIPDNNLMISPWIMEVNTAEFFFRLLRVMDDRRFIIPDLIIKYVSRFTSRILNKHPIHLLR